MRPVSADSESSTRLPESDSENAWDGEPRVIYSNVTPRVEHLKRSRNLEPYSTRPKSDGGGEGGGGSEASTATGSDSAPSSGSIASEKRRKSSDGGSRQKPGRQEVAREDDRRFVAVILDSQENNAALSPMPEITVIDASGRERRVHFKHQELEPVKIGSVVVVKEARSGAGLAAYVVGEEMHQVLVVGNGVACSPSLLTQELHALEHGNQEETVDERGERGGGAIGRSRLDGVSGPISGEGGGRDKAEDRVRGNGESRRYDKTDDIQARAFGLRQKALQRLLGGGGEEGGTPHDLFRQAADLGDPESFFYLALLQSAGLHGGEPRGGRAQAQTWAFCGAEAFSTNANLMLAYRFHVGIGQQAQMCEEAVNFYQQAVYELREGREDALQDLYPPPDAYRLGGEHGLGGWGVDIGEGILGRGEGAPQFTEAGGGGGIGGGGGGLDVNAGPRDVDVGDDVLLRAESGDPVAMMMMGHLYIVGSDEMAIKVNYAKAEELMWKAVRNGEPAAYSYLAWMHHNGHIGGHLPPEQQPSLPPGGDGRKNAWAGPKTEQDMREAALEIWGKDLLAKTSWGKGGVSRQGGGGRGAGGGGWSWGWGGREGDEGEGFLLKDGEDIWGGGENQETWEWELLRGGVSGAVAAADLYLKGFREGDPACGAALAEMWLHSEYTDSRDGRGAGGKWSMMKAHLLFQNALDTGKKYGDPQTIAALRLGSMFEHGLVPYVGVNITKSMEYYQESVDSGGMDALLALAELNFYGYEASVNSSCKAGARFYKIYTDLCVKDTALASGRAAFERKQYQEAFFNYLIAAELGNKEGQASLAWLLEKGTPSPDARSPLYDAVLEAVASLMPGVIDLGGHGRARPAETEAGSVTGTGVGGQRNGLGSVIDNVRGMGGDPKEMARYYRTLAANQGDADARCEIADDIYRQAKAMGAVPGGTGWLPWVKGKSSQDIEGPRTVEGGSKPSSRASGGGTDERSEVIRLTREGDAMRLLDEAVKHYRLSCETEGGGSRRGLFSMGWLHQHGVGVNLDRGLARDYYRRSASAPAVLGLWLIAVSDLAAEIGAPLALSILLVAITALTFKLVKGVHRRRRRERSAFTDEAGAGIGGVYSRGGGGDEVNASPQERMGEEGATSRR